MNKIAQTIQYIIVVILPLLVITGCSKDDSPKPEEKKPIQIQKFRKNFPGMGVVKAKYNQGHYLVLLEKLSALVKIPGDRTVKLLNIAGETVFTSDGTSSAIIDADMDTAYVYTTSIVSITDYECIVVGKFDFTGKRVSTNTILVEANNIPVLDDRTRIVVSKQNLYVAVYKIDETTCLYALDKQNLSEDWSLLIEPAANRLVLLMIGGSYDAFAQLSNKYTVYLDTDEAGYAYVGITVMGGTLSTTVDLHNAHFGETLSLKSGNPGNGTISTDALVTKVSPEGQRVYTSVMGTSYHDEMHGLKVFQDKVITYGRCAITSLNDWDPYLTVHDANNGNELFVKNYDLAGNEMFLGAGCDTLTGEFYFGGVGGWSQNPEGVSVSEQGNKILFTVSVLNGSIGKTFSLQNGLRQNQVRSVQILGDNLIMLAGWENGPGTHSGDSDSNLVFADGFLEVQ